MVSEYVQEGIPFLRSQNVEYLRINTDDIKFITPVFHERLRKSSLSPGDVVIVRTGKPGTCAVIPPWLPVANCSDLVIVRCGDNLNAHFLAYINSVASHHVAAHLVGAVQQHFNVGSARTMRLKLPPIYEQRVITYVLRTLDDKIELNYQMNKTLEAIGKAIFKHWFVDFEFPNEEGKPYKSSGGEMVYSEELGTEIPKGWRVGEFNEIIHLTMGLSPKGESYNVIGEGIPLINGAADFSDDKIVPKKFTTQSTRVCKKDDLLFCIRGTIGNLTYADRSYCLGRGVAAITTTNEVYKEYVYFILNNKLNAMISKATGSVIVGLSKPDILNLKILLPLENIMKAFHTQLESLFVKKEMNKEEGDNLSQIRNSILPKLMSGKIRVPIEVK